MISVKKAISVASLLSIGITVLGVGVEQLSEQNYTVAVPLLVIGFGLTLAGIYLENKE